MTRPRNHPHPDRRRALAMLAGAALAPPAALSARNACMGNGVCIAEVDLGHVRYRPQQASQWCWAAAAQILFSAYGYDLPQEEVVQAVYGSLVDLPALNTQTISRLLSRTWEDAEGRRFRCRIRGLYDVYAGAAALNNLQIVQALAAEQPLFYCNRSHAMVLTAMASRPVPGGLVATNIGLIDPWPGQGARGPHGGEMMPAHLGGDITYVALPIVTELD